MDEGRLLQVWDEGDKPYDSHVGHAYLHLDDGSSGDEGRDLGWITLREATEIAQNHDAELDVDGPTREEWEALDATPRRSFFDRLRGR